MSENDACVNLLKAHQQIKEENEELKKRLGHLLRSEYIRSFDRKNPITGEYERDIRDAGKDNEEQEVYFVCDRRKCEKCSENCHHTKDVRHAKNFTLSSLKSNSFWEGEQP